MNTSNQKSLTDVIIEGLKAAATELEEFRVQAALGKAEARDAYEDAKKKFRHFIHEAGQSFASSQSHAKDRLDELRAVFETLQVQLALGKAETREAFEEQRKKILQALHAIENFLENNGLTAEYYKLIHNEIAKFRIKLEILRLRYELNKMDAREEFEARKREFAIRFEKIKENLHEKEKGAEKMWDQFRQDIAEAYGDLKKAFVG